MLTLKWPRLLIVFATVVLPAFAGVHDWPTRNFSHSHRWAHSPASGRLAFHSTPQVWRGHRYGAWRPAWRAPYRYGWPYRSGTVISYRYGYPGYSFGVYDDVYVSSAYPARANYATNGLLWGALAGAVIGNNSGDLGHNAWRGAAYGALGGYVLGAIADRRAEARAAESVAAVSTETGSSVVTPTPAPPVSVPSTPAVTEPSRRSSSMADANRLFGR